MSLGERLKKIRGTMTQEEFAETIGVKPLQVSRIERDKSGMSLELAVTISKRYGCTVDWLSMGKENPLPSLVQEPKVDFELQSKYLKLLEENNELHKKLNKEQTIEIEQLQTAQRG